MNIKQVYTFMSGLIKSVFPPTEDQYKVWDKLLSRKCFSYKWLSFQWLDHGCNFDLIFKNIIMEDVYKR